MGPDENVTLAEVNRNVSALRVDVRDLGGDVGDLKTAAALSTERVGRLERVVYGAVATALASAAAALAGLVQNGAK